MRDQNRRISHILDVPDGTRLPCRYRVYICLQRGTPYWLRAEPGRDRGRVDRIPVSHACAADRSFEVKLVRPAWLRDRAEIRHETSRQYPAAARRCEVLCFACLD